MIQEFIDDLMNACYTKTSCISVSDKMNNFDLSFTEIIYDVKVEEIDDNRIKIYINGSGDSEVSIVLSKTDDVVFDGDDYFITTATYDYVFSLV